MLGGILIFITGIGSALLWCDLANPFIWALLTSAAWFAVGAVVRAHDGFDLGFLHQVSYEPVVGGLLLVSLLLGLFVFVAEPA